MKNDWDTTFLLSFWQGGCTSLKILSWNIGSKKWKSRCQRSGGSLVKCRHNYLLTVSRSIPCIRGWVFTPRKGTHSQGVGTYPLSLWTDTHPYPLLPPLWTEAHLWKQYLPATSFAGGKNKSGPSIAMVGAYTLLWGYQPYILFKFPETPHEIEKYFFSKGRVLGHLGFMSQWSFKKIHHHHHIFKLRKMEIAIGFNGSLGHYYCVNTHKLDTECWQNLHRYYKNIVFCKWMLFKVSSVWCEKLP